MAVPAATGGVDGRGKNSPAIGATSRVDRLRSIDGRTAIGRRLRQIVRELVAHVGGQPSAPQRYLIDRVAVDLVRLEMLDAKIASATFSAHDGRVAHALRNSVRLALRELGLQSSAPKIDPMARLHEALATPPSP